MTINELAIISQYSKFYFLRRFKQQTGITPYEYIITYRLNKSKELLMQSDYSIEAISGLVGFESVSNFIKHFKRYEDTTPTKFRKRNFL
ncbi:MAG: helix-turn-helix transcriptional regulator [Angelakisella sp.]|nr:helix-turn-helix transcriptional regulator [Angelakisella sp.]